MFPVAALWLVLFLGPAILLVVYSFGQISILTFDVSWGWTLEHYEKVFTRLTAETLAKSFALSFGATVGCLLIGYPTALFISRQRRGLQQLLLLLMIVPFWTSFVVRTYAWVNLLKNGGPIENIVNGIGIHSGQLDLLFTNFAVGLGMVYTYLPLMVLPLFVALDRIDPNLLRAASDLGAPNRRSFLRVTLPLSMPGVIAGSILVGVPAAGEVVVPGVLGGGKSLMFGTLVDSQFRAGQYPFGAALATVFMAILTVILLISRKQLSAIEEVA